MRKRNIGMKYLEIQSFCWFDVSPWDALTELRSSMSVLEVFIEIVAVWPAEHAVSIMITELCLTYEELIVNCGCPT